MTSILNYNLGTGGYGNDPTHYGTSRTSAHTDGVSSYSSLPFSGNGVTSVTSDFCYSPAQESLGSFAQTADKCVNTFQNNMKSSAFTDSNVHHVSTNSQNLPQTMCQPGKTGMSSHPEMTYSYSSNSSPYLSHNAPMEQAQASAAFGSAQFSNFGQSSNLFDQPSQTAYYSYGPTQLSHSASNTPSPQYSVSSPPSLAPTTLVHQTSASSRSPASSFSLQCAPQSVMSDFLIRQGSAASTHSASSVNDLNRHGNASYPVLIASNPSPQGYNAQSMQLMGYSPAGNMDMAQHPDAGVRMSCSSHGSSHSSMYSGQMAAPSVNDFAHNSQRQMAQGYAYSPQVANGQMSMNGQNSQLTCHNQRQNMQNGMGNNTFAPTMMSTPCYDRNGHVITTQTFTYPQISNHNTTTFFPYSISAAPGQYIANNTVAIPVNAHVGSVNTAYPYRGVQVIGQHYNTMAVNYGQGITGVAVGDGMGIVNINGRNVPMTNMKSLSQTQAYPTDMHYDEYSPGYRNPAPYHDMHNRNANRRAREAVMRPKAKFIADVTLPDRSRVHMGQKLVKVWRLYNAGSRPWPEGTCVTFIRGDATFPDSQVFPVSSVNPNESVDVTITLTTPHVTGRCMAVFRLADKDRVPFGPRMWVDLIAVPEGESLEAAEGDDAICSPLETLNPDDTRRRHSEPLSPCDALSPTQLGTDTTQGKPSDEHTQQCDHSDDDSLAAVHPDDEASPSRTVSPLSTMMDLYAFLPETVDIRGL